ncbi:protein CIA1 isoform X1 [Selaginella moellendorffii]|uniref:protein CIA1 isoform X1 n=1 Tax=Selaginella moellendorffii TaxID=88036 RepID=UPI000D1D061E|nr:protein CIA1 isoform X1 [Selaginella moellendorffii]|eukprot:XP_024515677.1 protein CIA1 isoform X1 [Selaginella moellendorffii]
MAVAMEAIQELEGHTDRVWSVAWNPVASSSNRSVLASCGGDKTVRIWEGDCSDSSSSSSSSSWSCKAVIDSFKRTVRSCHWSPDGKLLATACFDGIGAVWEDVGGDYECVATLEGHENEMKSIAWSASGTLLATCGRDKSVWIWEMEAENDFQTVSVLNGHSQDVKTVLFHPTEDILVSSSYDNSIKVWAPDPNGDDWSCVQTLAEPNQGHSSTVWSVAFDADGKRMVSCSDDLLLVVWDTSTNPLESSWKHLCTLSGYHERTIYSVHWSRRSGLIASAAGDDAIRVFAEANDPSYTSRAVFSMVGKQQKAHSTDVNCVRWHPKDDDILASAGDDGLVKLWRILS